ARASAIAYAGLCAKAGRADGVGRTRLDLAAIALMSGDGKEARDYATSAIRSFVARGKDVDAALARSAWLRARLAEGRVDRAAVAAGLEAASVLDRAGWRRDAQ